MIFFLSHFFLISILYICLACSHFKLYVRRNHQTVKDFLFDFLFIIYEKRIIQLSLNVSQYGHHCCRMSIAFFSLRNIFFQYYSCFYLLITYERTSCNDFLFEEESDMWQWNSTGRSVIISSLQEFKNLKNE